MLTYQKELFVNLMPELPPLFEQHWRELGNDHEKIPLAPAWQQYIQDEYAGKLHIITIRDGKKLVGYYFGFIYNPLHYVTSKYSHSDMFFLHKDYKKGLAAGIRLKKLFLQAIKLSQDNGVNRMYISHKAKHDLSWLLEHLGFKLTDKVHTMTF